MNYAAVINGPFSSNNGNNHYSRLGYTPNGYGPQPNTTEQNPQMVPYQTFNSAAGQPVNVYQQIPPTSASRDPRTNIHIGSKLFVGQVPAMTTEEQLRPVFEPYGELLEVKIMRDPLGRSKGSAWVRYETNEMAMNAINALHEKHTVPPQTNPLRVQFATPNSVRHQQLQARYAVELKVPMNQYNFGGQMGGGTQQSGMVMLRSGASPNVVPPISANVGGRYMSAPFGGGPMESSSIMSGPYTSSANCFDGVNSSGNRRDLYSPLEQPQGTAPQLYQQQQQQQRGGFSSPVVTPPSVYNQASSTRQPTARNNNTKSGGGISMGSFESGHGMVNPNSNGAPTMANEMSTLDAGIALWEARNNNGLQGQEPREAAARVRSGERKEE
ncbi:RNA-binding protein, putative [Trypanosoma cruzi]|uniref:RNA-binding protein, putative n=1 Tax=Trypanosoma cruzi (strain CL Brener) TaxID=353153 RepID=Q4E5H3_TRYCC|nr:RNA-binding protein, putative [Trypanosoma cruzi]EAO00037.1 RNA-binding protein, putative [Trypanosoma cruzi]|eukprot:XP_821888.1 RNA-binding protein [Trypanosoma cruzi strain CL Brener]